MRRLATLILLTQIAIAWPGIGCNSGGIAGAVPVSGTVTYKNQPVAQATVTFIGEGEARTAVAITDTSGKYQLKTLDHAGAMPGKYSVLVSKTEIAAGSDQPISMDEAAQNRGKASEPKQQLPSKYGDPSKTPLRFEVQRGQANKFNLPLAD